MFPWDVIGPSFRNKDVGPPNTVSHGLPLDLLGSWSWHRGRGWIQSLRRKERGLLSTTFPRIPPSENFHYLNETLTPFDLPQTSLSVVDLWKVFLNCTLSLSIPSRGCTTQPRGKTDYLSSRPLFTNNRKVVTWKDSRDWGSPIVLVSHSELHHCLSGKETCWS